MTVLYQPGHWAPHRHSAQHHWFPTSITAGSPLELGLWSHLKKRFEPDLVHFPSMMRPLKTPLPWVMTLHDLIHLQFPQDYGLKHRAYYTWLRQRLPQARALLTVSQSSAQALSDWQPKIQARAIYLGTDLAPEAPAKPAQKEPYFLFVGNPKPHKGFQILYEAIKDLRLPLRTLGVTGPTSPHIRYLDPVDDTELYQLYRGARALILPSLAEGFGLPLLEAMRLGTPVIASDLPVFREIAGPHITYFQTGSVADLKRVLQQWGHSPDQPFEKRAQNAQTHSLNFSWERFGQQTLEVYRDCLS